MTVFKAQNRLWDNEYNSTKLLIPPGVLDKFREKYHIYSGNNLNPYENIQRVENMSREEYFNKLENSDVTFDNTFYNNLAKVVGQKDFVVKGFFNMEFKASI